MKQLLSTLVLGMLSITTLFANPGNPVETAPTSPATNLSFNNIDGNRLNIQWQNGNGARRIVIARKSSPVTAVPHNAVEYNANASFGKGSEIANGEFVVYNGNANNVTLTGLTADSNYHFAVLEYNGTGTSTVYIEKALTGNITTAVAPSFPPVGISITDITEHSMTLTWSDDLLKGSGHLVLIKADRPVNGKPSDLSVYTASNKLWSGSEIGNGNYVIYQGTGNTVTVENLEPNTVYHFALFEYNGEDGKVFNVSNPVRINASNAKKEAKTTTVNNN